MFTINGNMKKHKRIQIHNDILTIKPIGAGSEVGRSCILLKFKGKQVMFDCGIHPAHKGVSQLPFFDTIDPQKVDVVLISHFHMDHVGALPNFMEHTKFKGVAYMTNPTKAIVNLLLQDYVRVSTSNSNESDPLYTMEDLKNIEKRIFGIDYRQEVNYKGIKFWCYNAGHVLGAAMFMVNIAGIYVLYTGDFSSQEDRHLVGAEIPPIRPDVLLVESTYGTVVHGSREVRELRFKNMVRSIVTRGGKCLIPVFALGRAQELLLILDEYWQQTPGFHKIPIYYASILAEKCMSIYLTYINTMNENIKNQMDSNSRNPFEFRFIRKLRNAKDVLSIVGPCVVLASPGMCQSGLSRELFEAWCQDNKNGLVITGYCVEGTPAREVQSEPKSFILSTGEEVPFNMSVNIVSFSAHSDRNQTEEFVRKVKPRNIVFIHGSSKAMGKLRKAFEVLPHFSKIKFATPSNTDEVHFEFKREKRAKIIGSLAKKVNGETDINGIVISREYQTHLVQESDLKQYFNVPVTGVVQSTFLHTTKELDEIINYPYTVLTNNKEKVIVRILQKILLTKRNDTLKIEWDSNSTNDMIINHISMNVLGVNTQIDKIKGKENHVENRMKMIFNCLKQKYKNVKIIEEDEKNDDYLIKITMQNDEIVIVNKEGKVKSENEKFKKKVEDLVEKVKWSMELTKEDMTNMEKY